MELFFMDYEPKEIHVELTDKCNAQCPMCARTNVNDISKTTELVKNVEITFDEFKNIVKDIKFEKYIFCGNYGDPLSAKDFLKIIEYVADEKTEIFIHTNASLKTPSYFKKLGNILSINPNNNVFFALDGLEDTHAIYRQNTNFNKIIENAKAYITNTKAKSTWEYLVFKHNEHQVDIAKQKAKELGFTNFNFKYSNRFPLNNKINFYSKGNLNTIEKANFDTIPENYNKIQCKATQRKGVYLSAEGYLWPCCWLEPRYKFDSELKNIVEKCNIETINAHKYSINEIIGGMIWTEIENRWKYGKPSACWDICSRNSRNVNNDVVL
jgi:MoaA/NifB/PqqE/SkfB family radical SAM enzyme